MEKKCKISAVLLLFFAVSFCLCACSGKPGVVKKTYTVDLTSYDEKDLSYLDAKKIALDTIGLSSYNPFIISIECLRGKYVFMFYTIDLDKIYRVEVNRQSRKARIVDIKDNTFDFLRTSDFLISAEKALYMSLQHARVQIPTGYTYYAFLAEFNEEQVFKVCFGTKKQEFSYMVGANEPGVLMGRDVYDR